MDARSFVKSMVSNMLTTFSSITVSALLCILFEGEDDAKSSSLGALQADRLIISAIINGMITFVIIRSPFKAWHITSIIFICIQKSAHNVDTYLDYEIFLCGFEEVIAVSFYDTAIT